MKVEYSVYHELDFLLKFHFTYSYIYMSSTKCCMEFDNYDILNQLLWYIQFHEKIKGNLSCYKHVQLQTTTCGYRWMVAPIYESLQNITQRNKIRSI